MSQSSQCVGELRWRFGADRSQWADPASGMTVDLSIPVLDGLAEGRLTSIPDGEEFTHGAFRGYRSDSDIAAAAVVPLSGAAPEDAARALYDDVLDLTSDLPAYRTWNFVPRINADIDGLEAYRSFNLGRGSAYEARFGCDGMGAKLPAASALGIQGDSLFVAFLGGTQKREFFENPNQVPASEYPPEYGARSPSFARGSVVHSASGGRTGYLSGTSSILGHETIGVGDLAKQAETTFDNVRGMIAHMGFDLATATEVEFRVYVRNRSDLDFVRNVFFEAFDRAAENTVFVQADICRQTLFLEVEAIVTAA